MFSIFNTGITRKLNKIPLYPNINLNNIIFSQLILFKKYMLEEDFFVNNKHPLVTLLNECFTGSFMDMIPDEVAYRVKETAINTGNVIGMVTDRGRGRYFKDGNLTYLIYLESDIEINKSNEYDIIKCVYTDYSILDFSYNTTINEFMILRINSTELILSYIDWKRKRNLTNKVNTFSVFIATIIIPKIWDTKTNQVLFNRFMLTYDKKPLLKYKNKHPIQLINREDLIDSENRRFIKFIRNNMKVNIYSLLYGYEWINRDMLDILSFDEKIFLSSTSYLLYLARAKYVVFFLRMIKENKSEAINIEYVNELYVTLRRINNGLIRLPELPQYVIDNFNNDMKEIKKIIDYR